MQCSCFKIAKTDCLNHGIHFVTSSLKPASLNLKTASSTVCIWVTLVSPIVCIPGASQEVTKIRRNVFPVIHAITLRLCSVDSLDGGISNPFWHSWVKKKEQSKIMKRKIIFLNIKLKCHFFYSIGPKVGTSVLLWLMDRFHTCFGTSCRSDM